VGTSMVLRSSLKSVRLAVSRNETAIGSDILSIIAHDFDEKSSIHLNLQRCYSIASTSTCWRGELGASITSGVMKGCPPCCSWRESQLPVYGSNPYCRRTPQSDQISKQAITTNSFQGRPGLAWIAYDRILIGEEGGSGASLSESGTLNWWK